MNKILVLGGLVLIGIGGFFALNAFMYQEKQNDDPAVEYARFFHDELFARGTADGLIPIEGFDADLLLGEFSGLVPSDFDGVEAFEGVYRVEGNAVVFDRTFAEPVSSAERTVSDAGYATLLQNVARRLGVALDSKEDVETLLATLDQRAYLDASFGETVAAYGARVTPEELLEDSRCPSDVECVWAGTVRVRAVLESGLGRAPQEFVLGTPITTEAETITLVRVEPYPVSAGEAIAQEAYRFYFEITKRP